MTEVRHASRAGESEDAFERAVWDLYRAAVEAKKLRPSVVLPNEHRTLGEVLDLVTDTRHGRQAA